MAFNPDMDEYTDDMFEMEQDLDNMPESFITNLPRYQRPYVVEAVLMCGFPLYIVDNATNAFGEPDCGYVELHCKEPGSALDDFWEVFNVLAAKRK